MSQTQKQYSIDNELIKDRSSYWPGHITAECLIDDNDEIDDIQINAINNNNTQDNTNPSNSETTNQSSNTNSNKELLKTFKLLTKLKPGGAFSAIISSMIPYDILTKSIKSKSIEILQKNMTDQDFVYDEFGFKIVKNEDESNEEDEDVLWSKNDKRMPKPEVFVEDSKHKLKWIAYLEFTLNADIGSNFSWDQVISLNKCEKMKLMIRGQGIPHSLRPFVI